MGTADCSVICKAGLAEPNSVQPIFLRETRGKDTSACRGGGQQVAENGGNERAVPSWVLLMRFRNGAHDVAREWKRHPWPKSSLALRASCAISVSRRFARCSTVNTGVPWEAQEIPLFACIWPAPVYSDTGKLESLRKVSRST